MTVPYELVMPPVDGPIHLRKEARARMGDVIEQMSRDTGFTFGPRGWAYFAEGEGLITKGEFDRFCKLLVDMRKAGEMDPDVIEPDASRLATMVTDYPADTDDPEAHAQWILDQVSDQLRRGPNSYHQTGFWDHLEYYVELIVEKKDLVQIFRNVCDRYKVRITNGKGDTDIHSRLAMLKRFRDHSYEGRKPVLLAVGDHDPKGLSIVEGLQRTMMSCKDIKGLDWPELAEWEDWEEPLFDVVNVGLTEEQIDDLGLMRIENLETGGGKDLSDPRHKDHLKPYVQDYIGRFGVWKCEANALVSDPAAASRLLEEAINPFIPEYHLQQIRDTNQPGQDAAREAIAELMKNWSFD